MQVLPLELAGVGSCRSILKNFWHYNCFNRAALILLLVMSSVVLLPSTAAIAQPKPTITTEPIDIAAKSGNNIEFKVVASGAGLTYQWLKDGTPIPGAILEKYSLTVKLSDGGSRFSVKVTNVAGDVTSRGALLTVEPTISAQPADTTVKSGQSASFSVSATGVGLVYQWYRDGSPISGASSDNYSFTVSLADRGSRFSVKVSNAAGDVTSRAALLSVMPIEPNIVSEPSDSIDRAGSSAGFSVAAGGEELSYQWYRDDSAISGANASSYSFTASLSDNGSRYKVEVSNSSGSVVSRHALLSVIPDLVTPAISGQPVDQAVYIGQPLVFQVAARGSDLRYQWYKDGVPIVNANFREYPLTPKTIADAGSYFVRVSNDFGTVDSRAAKLTVGAAADAPKITITTHPVDQRLEVGQNATLNALGVADLASVDPSTPKVIFRYQWYKNGAPILGAAGETDLRFILASLDIRAEGIDNNSQYYVIFSSSTGFSVESNRATLSVYPGPIGPGPTIADHPLNVTIKSVAEARFNVRANGAVLSYQWRRNGVPIAGANGPSYSFAPESGVDSGVPFTVLVSNPFGLVESRPAYINFDRANLPIITLQPSDVATLAGEEVGFSVIANGVFLSYQWKRNGSNIPGATSSRYSFTARAGDSGAVFSVVVRGVGGSIESRKALLTVGADRAAIVDQPRDVSVRAGDSAEFSVTASGSALRYQWKRDGKVIPEATKEKLTISVDDTMHGARFSVVVSNDAGSVESRTAVLRLLDHFGPVLSGIEITRQPEDLELASGSIANFSVIAKDRSVKSKVSLQYQWYKDGAEVSGATDATYTFKAQDTDDNSSYTVRVFTSDYAEVSNPAVLTISVTTKALKCTGPSGSCNPVNSLKALGKAKNWYKNDKVVEVADKGTATTKYLPLPAAKRIYYDPFASRPYPNDFLVTAAAPVADLAGCWDDVYASFDQGKSALDDSWTSSDLSLSSVLPLQLIRIKSGNISVTDSARLGINFSSESLAKRGHQIANSSSWVSVHEQYAYFLNHVKTSPAFRSYSESRGDRSIDLYDGLFSHIFNSVGGPGSEMWAIKKMAIAACALPRETKTILKRTGNLASSLLYIYKSTLPYASDSGADLPYDSELRHRVAYLTNGGGALKESDFFIGKNQSFHRYSDETHLYRMVQLAQSMSITAPVAIVKLDSFSVTKGAKVLANHLKRDPRERWLRLKELTQIKFWGRADQTIEAEVDFGSSYDLMGRPLSYHVAAVYQNQKNVEIIPNGSASKFLIRVRYDAKLPKGRIPIMAYVDNGVFESNPVFVNFYFANKYQFELPRYVTESAPETNLDLTINARPQIKIDAAPAAKVNVGDVLTFRLSCVDPEGFSTKLYRWSDEIGSLDSSGLFSLTITPDLAATTQQLHFICSDGTGAFGSLEVPFVVN